MFMRAAGRLEGMCVARVPPPRGGGSWSESNEGARLPYGHGKDVVACAHCPPIVARNLH